MNEYRPDPSFAVTQVGPLEPKLGSWLDTRGLQAFGVQSEEEREGLPSQTCSFPGSFRTCNSV